MINAYVRAISQLSEPNMRRFFWIGVGAAACVFAILWTGIGWTINNTEFFQTWWLEWAVDLLGGVVVVVLTWILFPGIAGIVIGFLLDGVASAVEARHYPGLPAPRQQSLSETLLVTVKFLALIVALNLVILVFLFAPPVFPFVFYGVNGYLLGREYFELVALRRCTTDEANAMRRTHGGRMTMAGVVMAFLLTIPVVNLAAPIIATAAMVHLFQAWRGQGEG